MLRQWNELLRPRPLDWQSLIETRPGLSCSLVTLFEGCQNELFGGSPSRHTLVPKINSLLYVTTKHAVCGCEKVPFT
jgi:hypothetical protein